MSIDSTSFSNNLYENIQEVPDAKTCKCVVRKMFMCVEIRSMNVILGNNLTVTKSFH